MLGSMMDKVLNFAFARVALCQYYCSLLEPGLMAARRGAKPAGWYPRRGEVCLFVLDKERPALVISCDALNIHSLDVCVVPISTVEHKAFSLRPKIKAGDLRLGYKL